MSDAATPSLGLESTPPTTASAEELRLARLAATGLLDSPPEPAFDRATRIAARLLDAPVALVSLVDRDRLFFKSTFGLPEPWQSRREATRSRSLCQEVVLRGRPLLVPNAADDCRFRDCLASTEFGVSAYLGVPLNTRDGLALGVLCVVDVRPRAWTEEDVSALADLAASVMTELALKEELARAERADRQLRLLSLAVEEANDAIVISEACPLDAPGPRVVYVNKAFTQATGYLPEEILGRTPRLLQGPRTDRATLDEIRRRLTSWEPVRAEVVNYRKDGSEFWVELNI
ncbi:MAG: GAF domain-containing protein, partial [Isosphaeraceae bacterium]